MKLQINNTGTWKQVLDFGAEHQTEVMHLVSRLAEVEAFANRPSKWRLVDDYEAVVFYRDGERGWYEPKRRSA